MSAAASKPYAGETYYSGWGNSSSYRITIPSSNCIIVGLPSCNETCDSSSYSPPIEYFRVVITNGSVSSKVAYGYIPLTSSPYKDLSSKLSVSISGSTVTLTASGYTGFSLYTYTQFAMGSYSAMTAYCTN